MTRDPSPSNQQVDDFLSNLSQLSQERLREDQQRQRTLERNINELYLKLASSSPFKPSSSIELRYSGSNPQFVTSIPELKFSRDRPVSLSVDVDEDDGPPLPTRPTTYDTDDSNPPTLPKRRDHASAADFSIELIKPVARKSSASAPPVKPKPTIAMPDFVPSKTTTNQTDSNGGYRSFSEIEQLIKHDVATFEKNAKMAPPVPSKKLTSGMLNAFESTPGERKEENEKGRVLQQLPPRPAKRVEGMIAQIKSGNEEIVEDDSTLTKIRKPPKKDWLSSTLDNSKTMSYQNDDIPEKQNPTTIGRSKTYRGSSNTINSSKKDWLSSTLENSKVPDHKHEFNDITPKVGLQADTKESNHNQLPPRPAKKDWLTSLSNSKVAQQSSTNDTDDTDNLYSQTKSPKKDWLSSTLENSKTSINKYDASVKSQLPYPGKPNTALPPRPAKKADWLTSLSNSKYGHSKDDESSHLQSPVKSPKKDWLSSTLTNPRTTVTQYTEDDDVIENKPATISRSISMQKKGDWLSSLANSKRTTSTPQSSEFQNKSVSIVIPKSTSIKRFPKEPEPVEPPLIPTRLALKKTDIPESKPLKPEPGPPNEEYRTMFEKLRTPSPTKQSPTRDLHKLRSPVADNEEIVEFENKLARIRSQSPTKDPGRQAHKYNKEPSSSEIIEFEKKLSSLKSQSPTRAPISKTKAETEFIAKFEKLKSSAPPPLKPKPLIKPLTEDPPPEFQKRFDKIVAKAPPKPTKLESGTLRKYEEKDAELLRSQLQKLGAKKTPTDLEENIRVKDKQETLPFQQQLGAILSRGHTVPSLQPKSLRRTSTDVDGAKVKREDTKGSGKLVHASKSRAKGPKRRLPKTMQTSEKNVNAATTTEEKDHKDEDTAPTSEEKHPKDEDITTINDYKNVKKIPPPINKHKKPKEIGELKPSRIISGEVFI